MGQDLSVVCIPGNIDEGVLLGLVDIWANDSEGRNIVVIFGGNPQFLMPILRGIEQYSVFSVWSDCEADLNKLAAVLADNFKEGCLVVTSVESASVGGWQYFERGNLVNSRWLEGDGYLEIAGEGLAKMLGCAIPGLLRQVGSLVGILADPVSGFCIRGECCELEAGRQVSLSIALRVFENDLEGAALECALGAAV